MDEKEIMARLSASLSPHRYTHTLHVAETARHLAPRVGVDPKRAYLAGLLHDCAKGMTLEEMRAFMQEHDTSADALERQTPEILHAPVGATLARTAYGITDAEILSAIRKHTIGGMGMTPLETLVYVADFIEPGRRFFHGLSEVRALAETDLYEAARRCAALTMAYVQRRGGRLHPATREMLACLAP